jgi:hypothetical protein
VDADPESALRAIPLFASLDGGAMADLAGCMTSFEAPAGQVLVEIGQPGSGLFVIQDGKVQVELSGRALMSGPGDFFGEIALLTDRPRTARVGARPACGAGRSRGKTSRASSRTTRRSPFGCCRSSQRSWPTRPEQASAHSDRQGVAVSPWVAAQRNVNVFTTPTAFVLVNMLTTSSTESPRLR